MASQPVPTVHRHSGGALHTRSRRPRWLGALLIGALLTGSMGSWPALASEALPGVDLASVHAWLREHNPQLQALQLEAEAADARVLPAGALPDPMVAVTLKEIDPDRPSLLPGNVGSTLYEVRQRIPLWGKRELSRELARNQAQGLRHEREAMAREILAEAEDAYVRYWHADEAVAIIDRQIALLEQIEEVAGVRYAVGMAAQQDSIRAQVERTNMQRQRIERLAGRREASVALNVALGRRADAALAAPAAQPILVVRDGDLGEALASLQLDGHPALQASIANVEAARSNVELQRRDRYPDITLGFGAMQRGDGIDGYEVMLEVEIPFQQRARRERERASRLLESAALARTDVARLELEGRLGTAWARWNSAREQRQLIQQTLLPQSDANFQSALASYQVGDVDFGTLLEALREWQGADLARVDSTRDELLGAAAVRAIQGDTP